MHVRVSLRLCMCQCVCGSVFGLEYAKGPSSFDDFEFSSFVYRISFGFQIKKPLPKRRYFRLPHLAASLIQPQRDREEEEEEGEGEEEEMQMEE